MSVRYVTVQGLSVPQPWIQHHEEEHDEPFYWQCTKQPCRGRWDRLARNAEAAKALKSADATLRKVQLVLGLDADPEGSRLGEARRLILDTLEDITHG